MIVEAVMRRGRDYRLNIALKALDAGAPEWLPPAGEREHETRKRNYFTWRSLHTTNNAHPDVYLVMQSQAIDVCKAQRSITSGRILPPEQTYYQVEFSLMNHLLANLTDEETHRLAEDMAMDNAPAMMDLPGEESTPLPPLYSTKWERVSDETFEWYGDLKDRRGQK